jgi:hypothetical protein
MGMTDKSKRFHYDHIIKKQAEKLIRCLDLFRNPSIFYNQWGEPDKEYTDYISRREEDKLDYLKEQIENIIYEADKNWMLNASYVGLGVPLRIREERDFLFKKKDSKKKV